MTRWSVRERLLGGPSPARRSEAFLRAVLWLLVIYSFVVWAVALLDWVRHPLAPSPYQAFGGRPAFRAFALFAGAPVTVVLGGLILRRHEGNIVGLLILAWGAGFASWGISVEIEPLLYVLVSLPIGAWWMLLIFLPFYFPDGHAYPSWLSPILGAIIVLALIWGGSNSLAPSHLDYSGQITNPLYVSGIQAASHFLETVFSVLMLPMIAGVFVSPLLRYRRADYVHRQQIKWFAWWSMIVFTPYLLFYAITVITYPQPSEAPAVLQLLLSAFVGLIGLFPPLIIALAILRYRLYDIDVIIRKTLVYSLLTALLALLYFGSVILLQTAFEALTGERSPVVIVMSTLLIAALFTPLRRRIQSAIDRRFFRKKYDAQQVLAQFAAAARNEVSPENLSAALAKAVQETVQPTVVRIWLRPVAGPSGTVYSAAKHPSWRPPATRP